MLVPGPTEFGGAWSGLAWQSKKRSWRGILRGVTWKMVHPSEGPEGLLPSYAAAKKGGWRRQPPSSGNARIRSWDCFLRAQWGEPGKNVQICVVERAAGSHEQKEGAWEEGQGSGEGRRNKPHGSDWSRPGAETWGMRGEKRKDGTGVYQSFFPLSHAATLWDVCT